MKGLSELIYGQCLEQHLAYSKHLLSISDEEDVAAAADVNGDDATSLHRIFQWHPIKLRIKCKMLVEA